MKSFKGNIGKVQVICPTLQKEKTLIFLSNIYFFGGVGGGGGGRGTEATAPLASPLATAINFKQYHR